LQRTIFAKLWEIFQNCGEKIFPHSFESNETRGKDQFPIVCENEPEELGFSFN